MTQRQVEYWSLTQLICILITDLAGAIYLADSNRTELRCSVVVRTSIVSIVS